MPLFNNYCKLYQLIGRGCMENQTANTFGYPYKIMFNSVMDTHNSAIGVSSLKAKIHDNCGDALWMSITGYLRYTWLRQYNLLIIILLYAYRISPGFFCLHLVHYAMFEAKFGVPLLSMIGDLTYMARLDIHYFVSRATSTCIGIASLYCKLYPI